MRLQVIHVAGMGDVHEVLAEKLFLAVAEQAGGGGVDLEVAAFQIDQNHADWRIRKCGGEQDVHPAPFAVGRALFPPQAIPLYGLTEGVREQLEKFRSSEEKAVGRGSGSSRLSNAEHLAIHPHGSGDIGLNLPST